MRLLSCPPRLLLTLTLFDRLARRRLLSLPFFLLAALGTLARLFIEPSLFRRELIALLLQAALLR